MDFLTIATYFDYNPEVLWMIVGGLLFVMEVFVSPGFGLVFGAFSALTLGGLMAFGVVEDPSFYVQLSYFLGLTIGWTVILWKPLKNMMKPEDEAYDNFVGTTALVINNDLLKSKIGTVKWSGAVMRAKISPDSSLDIIKVNEDVWIHKVENSIMLVDIKSISKINKNEE